MPLTSDNVHKNIKSVSKKWRNLGVYLGTHWSTMLTLESDGDGLAAVIKEWLEGGGLPPTWRTLYWALFNINEIAIAKEIGKFVEPIKGVSYLNLYQLMLI